jgi:hypothetical protein
MWTSPTLECLRVMHISIGPFKIRSNLPDKPTSRREDDGADNLLLLKTNFHLHCNKLVHARTKPSHQVVCQLLRLCKFRRCVHGRQMCA